MIQVVFETYSISDDNEAGRASGWNHSWLSPGGRQLAAELGRRRRDDGETVRIAFDAGEPPLFLDWRLTPEAVFDAPGMQSVNTGVHPPPLTWFCDA